MRTLIWRSCVVAVIIVQGWIIMSLIKQDQFIINAGKQMYEFTDHVYGHLKGLAEQDIEIKRLLEQKEDKCSRTKECI